MGEDFEFRLRQLEEDSARNLSAHKEFFDRFDKINVAQTRVETQYASILSALTKLEVAVEEIRAKPARRWDTVITALLTGVAGFLAAVILGTV